MSTRIQAMLTDEGYQKANEAFLSNWSNDEVELQTFVEEFAPVDMQGKQLDILSVGSGNGSRDARAIATLAKACQPSGISYTAVEPNEAQTELLKTNLEKHPDITALTVHQMAAEAYEYPEQKFDVILFTHSLYHMPGAEKELLKKSINALKPGGRIIIALSTEQGGIFQMMGSFWGVIDYSHFEQGSGLFGQEKLVQILEEDYSKQFDFKPLPHVYIDVTAIVNDGTMGPDLLNFVMQSDTTKLPDTMVTEIKTSLKELAVAKDDSLQLSHGSGLAVVFKELKSTE